MFLNTYSMETLMLQQLSVKFMKQNQRNNRPCIYCVLKWADQMYCSRNYQVISKDWIQIINMKTPLQMQMNKSHLLFKIEIWNYDTQQNIGQTNITINDLTQSERYKQFSINERQIHLRFVYDRKDKMEQRRDNQNSSLRISCNKSDPNLIKIPAKPSSAYIKKINYPHQQIPMNSKNDSSYFGKWKFIPVRHELGNHKLKL